MHIHYKYFYYPPYFQLAVQWNHQLVSNVSIYQFMLQSKYWLSLLLSLPCIIRCYNIFLSRFFYQNCIVNINDQYSINYFGKWHYYQRVCYQRMPLSASEKLNDMVGKIRKKLEKRTIWGKNIKYLPWKYIERLQKQKIARSLYLQQKRKETEQDLLTSTTSAIWASTYSSSVYRSLWIEIFTLPSSPTEKRRDRQKSS